MSRAQLDKELFAHGSADPVVEVTMSEWLASSRRFTAFVAENLPKVRKKLRAARDPQSAGEVLFELDTAYRLLRHKAHGLVYEPFVSSKERGPDFAVSYNGRPWLLLEVTRLGQPGIDQLDLRLARAVAGKLCQFQVGDPNVLLVGVERLLQESTAVASALTGLARAAESADSDFFARVGLRDRSDFFKHYERLSLVLVTQVGAGTGGGFGEWVNPRARSPLENPGPTSVVRALS